MSGLDKRRTAPKARRGFAAMPTELQRELSRKGSIARFFASGFSGRPRAFDYDHAKRLKGLGFTLEKIAETLGCSYSTAFLACNDVARERLLKTGKARRDARRSDNA